MENFKSIVLSEKDGLKHLNIIFKNHLLIEGDVYLSHFVDMNNSNINYLERWVDSDNSLDRSMLFEVSNKNLIRFFRKKITLLHLINMCNFVYFIDIDDKFTKVSLCYNCNIPKTYLPTNNGYYDEIQFEEYSGELLNELIETENNKTTINITNVLNFLQFKKFINSLPLENIEFVNDDNNTINANNDNIKEFKYCGLNNIGFIETGFLTNGFEKEINEINNELFKEVE